MSFLRELNETLRFSCNHFELRWSSDGKTLSCAVLGFMGSPTRMKGTQVFRPPPRFPSVSMHISSGLLKTRAASEEGPRWCWTRHERSGWTGWSLDVPRGETQAAEKWRGASVGPPRRKRNPVRLLGDDMENITCFCLFLINCIKKELKPTKCWFIQCLLKLDELQQMCNNVTNRKIIEPLIWC